MKTKTIIFGVVVAVLGILSLSQAKAQTFDPAVRILPTEQDGVIKLVYSQSNQESVLIKFMDAQGTIFKEKVKGGTYENGFLKKYKVARDVKDDFWIQVSNAELVVTYKMTAQGGQWKPEIEKATFYGLIASR